MIGDPKAGRLDKDKASRLAADFSQCGGCLYFEGLHGDPDWGLCAQFNRIVFEHDVCTEWRGHPWGWSRPYHRPDPDPEYCEADPSDSTKYSVKFLQEERGVEPPLKPFWWEEPDK